LDLNDSKFNATFVSGGYILLCDTGFYSEMSKTLPFWTKTVPSLAKTQMQMSY